VDTNRKIMFSREVASGQAAIEQLVTSAGATAAEARWATDLISSAGAVLIAVLAFTGQQVIYQSPDAPAVQMATSAPCGRWLECLPNSLDHLECGLRVGLSVGARSCRG
jgi:hypothetical protein